MSRAGANLDPTRTHWVPAVIAPQRDWPGAPGCRKGARYLIGRDSLRPTRAVTEPFDTRAECLRWIMEHRAELARNAPGAPIIPADLARWMLGLA